MRNFGKAIKAIMAVMVFACLGLFLPGEAAAQWKVSSDDGKSFIKLGFLFQGQVEFLDNTTPYPYKGTGGGRVGLHVNHEVAQNIFIRRFRILGGGNIGDKLSFFFETDSPNLGKYNATNNHKIGSDRSADGWMFLQDAFITYSVSDSLKVDAGMLLIPDSHNSCQGAISLLPVDYGPFSFTASTPTESRVGRDYGAEVRGYLFENHFEYRLGVFQGVRNVEPQDVYAAAPFRYVARFVFSPFDAETGYFYTGTTHGAKKILGIGFSTDLQHTYRGYGADFFLDWPLESGNVFTVQVNYNYFDGDDTFAAVLPQNLWLAELGLYNKSSKLGFFSQVALRDFVQSENGDENRYQAGLAYWADGHRNNLKLAYTWVIRKFPGIHDDEVYYDQFVLQWQVFMF